MRVRVSDALDANAFDTSDGNFKARGGLTLSSPNGTEIWIVGESRNITWSRTGSIANVKLEYSTDGGTTYSNIITASTPAAALSYSWAVPDTIAANLRVKVSDVSDASVYDTSDANFTIKGSLSLSSPNGGGSLGS